MIARASERIDVTDAPRAHATSRRRLIAVELDNRHWLRVIASDVGVRGAGRQRVNADVNVGEAQNGGKRRFRADARWAVVATALRTGRCARLWRDRCSARLSAPSAVFAAEVEALV